MKHSLSVLARSISTSTSRMRSELQSSPPTSSNAADSNCPEVDIDDAEAADEDNTGVGSGAGVGEVIDLPPGIGEPLTDDCEAAILAREAAPDLARIASTAL